MACITINKRTAAMTVLPTHAHKHYFIKTTEKHNTFTTTITFIQICRDSLHRMFHLQILCAFQNVSCTHIQCRSPKRCHLTFVNIFGKYWPILNILSHTQWTICNEVIIEHPTTPWLRRYTTLWNINFQKSLQP